MTTLEAFNLAIEKAKELKDSGIKVRISRNFNNYPRSKQEELKKKYSGSERAPHNLWCSVRFSVETKNQALKIQEASNYLGMCGISFDTSGSTGRRDWELDWSFKYTGKEDVEWRDAKNQLEDMLNDFED